MNTIETHQRNVYQIVMTRVIQFLMTCDPLLDPTLDDLINKAMVNTPKHLSQVLSIQIDHNVLVDLIQQGINNKMIKIVKKGFYTVQPAGRKFRKSIKNLQSMYDYGLDIVN